MSSHNGKDIKLFLKKYRAAILFVLCIVGLIIMMVTGPKTIASGNGYSHQVGSFGKCDMNFDDCTKNATHRRHHFFGNEDYCESCWDSYGQNMFDKLSKTKTTSDGIKHDEYKCRRTDCKNKAKYSDWEHRYCAEHLQGMKYCRYPNCVEQIPINGTSEYCSKHD